MAAMWDPIDPRDQTDTNPNLFDEIHAHTVDCVLIPAPIAQSVPHPTNGIVRQIHVTAVGTDHK